LTIEKIVKMILKMNLKMILKNDPEQGDIVGREYIISSKFMPPYGILLADSTIV
jgi:hypothetical protein